MAEHTPTDKPTYGELVEGLKMAKVSVQSSVVNLRNRRVREGHETILDKIDDLLTRARQEDVENG